MEFDESKIKQMIADQLEISAEQVTSEARFIDDLGADSLDVVELVMALEEQFDVEIADEQAEQIATVGDAISFIKKLAESQ